MLRRSGQDRFLAPRNGILCYWRRVPRTLRKIDTRAPIMRHSLKTDDLARACLPPNLEKLVWGTDMRRDPATGGSPNKKSANAPQGRGAFKLSQSPLCAFEPSAAEHGRDVARRPYRRHEAMFSHHWIERNRRSNDLDIGLGR
jgi:hypothetical protein